MAKFRPARFAFEIIDLLVKLGKRIAQDKDGGWKRSEVIALVNVAAVEGLDVMEAAGVVFEPEEDGDDEPAEPSAKEVRATARLATLSPGLLRPVAGDDG